jgi:hypothetical protein
MFTLLNKFSNYIFIAIIILICFLYFKSCVQNNADKSRIEKLLEYKHTVKNYTTKKGTVVNYNNSLAVSPEDLKIVQDTLLTYIENLELKLKNVKSTTIITERIQIDSVEVPVYLTDCNFDTTINVTKPFYDFNITMTNTGLTFNSLKFPNRLGVTLTDKKEKWYKPKNSIVAVTNSNPYMKVDGISTYTFKKQKKWYNRQLTSLTAGILLGAFTSYQITK